MKHKLLIFTLAALSLAVTVEAKNVKGNNNAAQISKNQKAQKDKAAAEKAERDKKRESVDAVLKLKDKNGDGSLTKEEYVAGETDADAAEKRFDKFNKNKDRYLSRQELETLLGL